MSRTGIALLLTIEGVIAFVQLTLWIPLLLWDIRTGRIIAEFRFQSFVWIGSTIAGMLVFPALAGMSTPAIWCMALWYFFEGAMAKYDLRDSGALQSGKP